MFWIFLFGLLTIAKAQTDGKRIFAWARSNGAYIHHCLEYRDNGMYTNCCIENRTTLIQIPSDLYIHHDGSWPEIRDNVASRFLYPDELDPFFDYFDSVQVDCYSTICRPENLTFMGSKYLDEILFDHEDIEPALLLAASTAYSRIWQQPIWALVPVIDLINHGMNKMNKTATILPINTTFTVTTGRYDYNMGEEIYINYGIEDDQQAFLFYGIENPDYVPTCEDYSIVRWKQFPEKRRACFENMTLFDLQHMELELVTAYQYEDFDMIKAARKWIELYWRNLSITDAPKIPTL